MKNKLTLMALVFSVSAMHSQYFQKMYSKNAVSNDFASKGANAVVNGTANNYFHAGTTVYTPAGTTVQVMNPMLSATDQNSAMIFCNEYPIIYNSTTNARGRAVAYYNAGALGRVMMLGDFIDLSSNANGVFILSIDAATGNVIPGSLNVWLNPLGAAKKITATAIKIVNGGSAPQVIACGQAESSIANSYNPWVMRYNITFTGGWFNVYDETLGTVPWNSRTNDLVGGNFGGANEIAVVGESVLNNDYRGFMLRLDGAGNVLSFPTFDSNVPGGNDRLTSITRCNDINPGQGYVMCGYSDVWNNTIGVNRVWGVRTDISGGAIYWNKKYTYPGMPICYSSGIIERLSTAGNYEYYISGTSAVGVIGGADVMVYKMNNMGTLIPGQGLTTIGTVGNINEYSLNLDYADNTTNFPGITLYSQRELAAGNNDFYMSKSYFNGATSSVGTCTYITSVADAVTQQVVGSKFSSTKILVNRQLIHDPQVLICAETPLCNSPSVADGNNSRPTGIDENSNVNALAFIAFPNPVGNSELLQLNIQSAENKTVHVELINLLGQVIISTDKQLTAGENKLELQIPEQAHGLHTVSISDGVNRKNTLIAIK